ncbi:hypothetical protein CCR75_000508 [Bremia lactucae]|uniref:Protein kinase domain-containing protein n=1 Tax=Bremia lactucae TaxID=4779 RepID=A0A976NZ05_BRELC|nr:hypothetical protein CCR75_000508 [Bremia lactucae]
MHAGDYPIVSSKSSVVPDLPAPFDLSDKSNDNTAAINLTILKSTSGSDSSCGNSWWKRISAIRHKRRRTDDRVDSRNAAQEMYIRSILESFLSSISSKERNSIGNVHSSVDDSCSNSSKTSSEQAFNKRRKERDKIETFHTIASIKTIPPAEQTRDSGSPAYMAHFTPNYDSGQEEHRVAIDSRIQLKGALGGIRGASLCFSDNGFENRHCAHTMNSDEEKKNRKRRQQQLTMQAMHTRILEKNQERARARNRIGYFIACSGVTLSVFVVAAVFIAKVGVNIQSKSFDTKNSTTISNSSGGDGFVTISGSGGSKADLTSKSSRIATDGDDMWTDLDDNTHARMYTDSYTYVHCFLMVLSLWMSLVVVVMHVLFHSFRTYSHPFVLTLSSVQCGYWITSLLRVMLETSSLPGVTYSVFCIFECFFNFAQISFACAIAFDMYRSVVSYVDVLMDLQSAKRRYHRYTLNVLIFSVMSAVALALAGSKPHDSTIQSKSTSSSTDLTEDLILDEETFSPCLNPTCRLILYVYYPLLAFAYNIILYLRFKRTIGKCYPMSATERLNNVARSYLMAFFVCWGSLILLTALKVSELSSVPLIAFFALRSVYDVLGVCFAVITLTNFHRCRKAFDFGLSLKAIDPSSIEFDDPVTIAGEGTFAVVLKAMWRQRGYVDGMEVRSIEVAVKTFKYANIECLEHVKEEAYLSSKLVHPCVMMTYGCYTSDCNLYIVYEYLGGGTLQKMIDLNQNTPFSYERGLRYALMIAVGMRFLHGLPVPIVHRDLKPLNCIFDSKQEMLKVADFGESRLLRTCGVDGCRPTSFRSADVTAQMTTNIGSACWAAPEVLKDEATSEYSVKIDVYSFGIICWQLFTCGSPYADIPGSNLAVAEAVLSGVRPTIPRGCPRLFAKIMQRCWDDIPIRRPNFEDIVQLLEIEIVEERRQQLMRTHGWGSDTIIAPLTLDSRNFVAWEIA